MNRFQRRGQLAAFLFVMATLALGACGEKDKSKVVVALVGDRQVTLDYFERKMNNFPADQAPVDFLTREGREEFLETIINKEVMAIKAEQLGMGSDGRADEAGNKMAELQAGLALREDVVAPYQNPTEADLLDYYENLSRSLSVSYMMFDTEKEALSARGLIVGGELWTVVAARLDAGDPGPDGNWTLNMKYGFIDDALEEKVFQLPVGEVSQPIESVYGYFLVRVDRQDVERVSPLEKIRDKVQASVIKQNSALALDRFRAEAFEEYGFSLDPEVMKIVYAAIPPDASLADPPPKEDLAPLDVQPEDLEKVLMSYGDQVWTVRKYSDYYDECSVFARPRREARMGGLRRALKEICFRELIPMLVRDRGYLDQPAARDEFKNRREQEMVTRLYDETIRGAVDVSKQEVEEYWQQHQDEFIQPESRKAQAVVAETEALGLKAQLEAQGGTDWSELVDEYCIESELKQKHGELPFFTPQSEGPIAEQIFRMNSPGDVSYPVELKEGQWLVVKLLEIKEENKPSLDDKRVEVGQRIQALKEEALFQQRVQEWKLDLEIQAHPERLMDAVYEPSTVPTDRLPGTVTLSGAGG